MISISSFWNPKQKLLIELLKNDSTFEEAISVCKELHKQVHDLKEENNSKTIYQELLQLITHDNIKYRPKKNFSSIAWNIWHITRIEDAITNILIQNTKQISNKEILHKINVNITDTGNAFSNQDVDLFDKQIYMKELLEYRRKVGKNTVKILQELTIKDRKRKPTQEQLNRIIQEKVVTKSLLTMPITRHQIVHINDCFKLVEKFKKEV